MKSERSPSPNSQADGVAVEVPSSEAANTPSVLRPESDEDSESDESEPEEAELDEDEDPEREPAEGVRGGVCPSCSVRLPGVAGQGSPNSEELMLMAQELKPSHLKRRDY